MKKIPIAVGLMVFGFFGVILGFANNWPAIGTGGSVMTFAGFFWFCWLWDSVVGLLNKVKYYDRRVRRVQDDTREQAAYRDLKDKSTDNRIKAIEKRNSQKIKGCIRSKSAQEAIMLNQILSN